MEEVSHKQIYERLVEVEKKGKLKEFV